MYEVTIQQEKTHSRVGQFENDPVGELATVLLSDVRVGEFVIVFVLQGVLPGVSHIVHVADLLDDLQKGFVLGSKEIQNKFNSNVKLHRQTTAFVEQKMHCVNLI